MNEFDRRKLLASLWEAALLPYGHPERTRITDLVAQQGGWMERQWIQVLETDERLRIGVRRVDVPEGLSERLLRIPEFRKDEGRAFCGQPIAVAMALAACFVLLVGVSLYRVWSDEDPFLQSVITLAIDDHLNDRRVEVNTPRPDDLVAQIAPKLPFSPLIPEFSQQFELVGGKAFAIGTNPVAYSLWTNGREQYSLFQFRHSDFVVRPADAPTLIRPANPPVAKSPCEVLYWSSREFGFLLVADHGELLSDIVPVTKG